MSSCVVEFGDHLYLYGCWWFRCKNWRFTPCPKKIVCKFLPNILRSYISSPRELHSSKKSKAVTITSNSVTMLFYSAFFNISFWKLKSWLWRRANYFCSRRNCPGWTEV